MKLDSRVCRYCKKTFSISKKFEYNWPVCRECYIEIGKKPIYRISWISSKKKKQKEPGKNCITCSKWILRGKYCLEHKPL